MREGSVGVIATAAIISCYIAFYNNYPLVYPDTGSYLHSGWEHVVFLDRTVFYGLFLRYFNIGNTVMSMVLWQGLLVCYLLYKLAGIFYSGLRLRVVYLSLIGFITIFTGFSYNVSILIPDIFSAITFLSLFNLLFNTRIHFLEWALIALIYVLSICTQLSTLPVISMLLVIVGLYWVYQKITQESVFLPIKKLLAVVGLTGMSVIVIPTVHYQIDGKFKISGGSHVFLMNHFIEQSVLDMYLKEHCGEKNYKMCAYKDSIAYLGWDFMWAEKSPLYKTGGWEANEDEYRAIIKDLLKDPKYRKIAIYKGLEYGFKQFFTFHTTVSPPLLEGSAPYGQIQWRLPDTAKEYISDRQNTNRLDLNFINAVEMPVFFASLIAALLFLFSPVLSTMLSSNERWLLATVIVYILVSAFICSNLSTIHARFQNRIVWILPFSVLLIVIRLYIHKKSQQAVK